MVVTRNITTSTRGEGHTVDIPAEVERAVREEGVGSGVVILFVVGSTAGLTTIEFEPGAVADMARVFEQIAPRDTEYQHELRWRVQNGANAATCNVCLLQLQDTPSHGEGNRYG